MNQPDPGEGWRNIDPKVDKPTEGDEVLTGSWLPRLVASDTPFYPKENYRRRLPQPEAKAEFKGPLRTNTTYRTRSGDIVSNVRPNKGLHSLTHCWVGEVKGISRTWKDNGKHSKSDDLSGFDIIAEVPETVKAPQCTCRYNRSPLKPIGVSISFDRDPLRPVYSDNDPVRLRAKMAELSRLLTQANRERDEARRDRAYYRAGLDLSGRTLEAGEIEATKAIIRAAIK